MPISHILGKHDPQAAEETAMHTITYNLAQARMTDLRDQAQQNTLARAAQPAGRFRGLGRFRHPGLRPLVPYRTRAVPGTAQSAEPAMAGDAPAR